MRRSWYDENPEFFAREKAEVETAYPQLNFNIEQETVVIRGTFPVVCDGKTLDRYAVEIELANNYPKSLPIVRETGGRIPKTPDRHVNQVDGTACVLLPDDRWRAWPTGESMLAYLRGPLHNYFLGQSLVERGEDWPFGQWPHGIDGVLAYYQDLLGAADWPTVRIGLEYLSAKKVKGHWECFCGSKKRLRNCHLSTIVELREKIQRTDARKALELLN